MVVRLHRAPGQREERYMHLLCGPLSMDMAAAASSNDVAERPSTGLSERVSQLESLVAQLQEVIAELQARPGNNGLPPDDETSDA